MSNSPDARHLRAAMLFAVLGGVLVLFVVWSSGAFPIQMRPWFLAGLGLLLVLATLVTRKSTRDGYWSRPAGPYSAEFLLALKHNLFSLALFFLMADPPSPWNPEFTWTTVRSQILFAIALWLLLSAGHALVRTRWRPHHPPDTPAPQ